MRSKLTKTILTIVFVVFLGLFKANTVDAYYAYCHYKTEDGNSRAMMYIVDSFESAKGSILSGSKSYSLSVINWASSGAQGVSYSAYVDSWKNDRCPQYLIFAKKGSSRNPDNRVYMTDSTNLNTYESLLKSNSYKIVTMTIDSNTFPNEKNEAGTYIPSRKCDCDNGLSYNIAEDGKLSTLKVGTKTAQNWFVTDSFAAVDLVKTNECLDLVYTSNGGDLYLTDAEHYSEAYALAGVGSGSEVKCKLNSRTPVKVKPKPEYNPPSVNGENVAPLNPNNDTKSCGNGYMTDIPSGIATVVRIIFVIIQILVPIALIITGTLDLIKAITKQKEDEIKAGQKTFVKRLVCAIIIFFVFSFVKIMVGIFSTDNNQVISCMNCFLEGECD